MFTSFPVFTKEIPRIALFTVNVNDAIKDKVYQLKYKVNNGGGFSPELNASDDYSETELFRYIEHNFTGKNLIVYDEIYVVANYDSAILLVEYIDSWIAQRAIMLKQGIWNGI